MAVTTEKVKDVMVRIENYATVNVDKPLNEAVASLRLLYCQVETGGCTEAGHRTTIVLNDQGEVVGILDFKGILRVLIPELAGGLSSWLESAGVSLAYAEGDAAHLDETELSFRARVVKNADTPVRKVMLKVRGTIDANASVLEALKSIHQNKVTVLPVIQDGKLVGVVRDSDLFLRVAEIFAEVS